MASWKLTHYPLLTNVWVQTLDNTAGMAFVALSEEAVFRFYLINLLLLRGMSVTAAIVLSTLIFAGIHWSYGAGSMAFAALAGLVFSVIFIRTRNLTVPVMIHAAYDTCVFTGGVAFLSRIYTGV